MNVLGLLLYILLFVKRFNEYKINLFQILNNMAKDYSDKMLEVLTSSSNIETTIEILKKASDIYKQVRQNFINKLKAFTEEEGFDLSMMKKLLVLQIIVGYA